MGDTMFKDDNALARATWAKYLVLARKKVDYALAHEHAAQANLAYWRTHERSRVRTDSIRQLALTMCEIIIEAEITERNDHDFVSMPWWEYNTLESAIEFMRNKIGAFGGDKGWHEYADREIVFVSRLVQLQ